MNRNFKKILIISVILFLLYTLMGFFLVPAIAKYILEKKVSETIHHIIAVEKIKFHPFKLEAQLENFRILDKDGSPLISLEHFLANFQIASLWQDAWTFKNISLTRPYIKTIILKGNALNLMAMQPSPQPSVASPQKKNQKTKNLIIRSFTLDNGAFDFKDESRSHVFHHVFEPINLQANNISTQPNDAGDAEIVLQVGQGQIKVINNMSLRPLQGSADITLENIPLNLIQPYLAEFSSAELSNGSLNITSHIVYNPETPSDLLKINGDISLQSLLLKDQTLSKDLLGLDALDIKGFDFTFPQKILTIKTVHLKKPSVHLALEDKNILNVARVFQPPAAETTSTPATSPAPEQTAQTDDAQKFSSDNLTIEEFSMTEGAVEFTDQTIQPNAVILLSDISTTLKPISLKPETNIATEFSARINETAKITSSGSLQPFAKPIGMNLSTTLENFSMKNLSSYIGKYVGFETNQGTLGLTINYSIAQGQFKGDHNLVLDTFILGKKTDSPEATKLPVKLALYLIEDLNQQIKLDLPVDGDMNDPTFRYSHVVIQVIMNVLTKALASPFNMLGGLLGGGPVDMSFAGFMPNQFTLSSDEKNKILTLAKALTSKPRLSLIIQGSADPSYDVLSDKDIRELKRLEAEGLPEYKPGTKDKIVNAYDKVTSIGGNVWPIRKIKSMIPEKEIEPVQLPPTEINMEALNLLAQQRAVAIKNVLITEGGIDPARVSIEENTVGQNFGDGVVKTNLSLSVIE